MVQWYGTDFNPSQAGFAKELAQVSKSDAQFFDESFVDFCQRSDLPDFDFIGLHGIWSWISDENRKVILDFIGRKLKVGGVLYISYNVQPGWSAFAPMRDLLVEYDNTFGANGIDITVRIDAALNFADQLLDVNPSYTRANPQVATRFNKLKEKSRNYLAHEYFNRDWSPMSFAQINRWLSRAKLSWACSAHYLDFIVAINLTKEQQQLLAKISDPIFRQLVRDFCTNQQFRRDYWVKGARKLGVLEQTDALKSQRIVLAQPREDISLKVTGSLGEANLQDTVYEPILDQLADYKPKSLGELEQCLRRTETGKSITFAQLLQAVLILCGKGAVLPAQDSQTVQKAKKCTDRLNSHLIKKAQSNPELNFLASPLSGGGISVPRIQQLFLLAKKQGYKTPQEWAQYVWNILSAQGQKIIKEGKVLKTVDENLEELNKRAKIFADKQLPILKALYIT